MANVFHLQIISPAKVVMDAHVSSIKIPGAEGDFSVLPGHATVFSMLRPGVIHVHMTDGAHRRFFAITGYADVTPEKCTLISDHVQDLMDISLAEAQEAVTAARTALAQAESLEQKAKAAKLLTSSEALLAAVTA